MGNKKKMQNISRHAEYCAALLGLHAFTSYGITHSFKCLGKVKHLKKLQSMPRVIPSLHYPSMDMDEKETRWDILLGQALFIRVKQKILFI